MLDLPSEIVHTILNLAASDSFQFALTLTLVSSWVRELALPHIYGTVVLDSHNILFSLQHTSGGTLKPRGAYVRRLWAVQRYHHKMFDLAPTLKCLSSLCRNIEDLSIPSEQFRQFLELDDGFPCLKMLTVSPGFKSRRSTRDRQLEMEDYLRCSSLQRITHYTLMRVSTDALIPAEALASLSHLALSFDNELVSLLSLESYLERCSQLELVAVMGELSFCAPEEYRAKENQFREHDERIVMFPVEQRHFRAPAWKEGETLWERARRFHKDGETDDMKWKGSLWSELYVDAT